MEVGGCNYNNKIIYHTFNYLKTHLEMVSNRLLGGKGCDHNKSFIFCTAITKLAQYVCGY